MGTSDILKILKIAQAVISNKWDHCKSQETMLMQNFGRENKQYFGIFESSLFENFQNIASVHKSPNARASSYDFLFIIHSTKLVYRFVSIATSVLHSITSFALYIVFTHVNSNLVFPPKPRKRKRLHDNRAQFPED